MSTPRRLVQVPPANLKSYERFNYQSGDVYELRPNGSLYRIFPLKNTAVRKMGRRAIRRLVVRRNYVATLMKKERAK